MTKQTWTAAVSALLFVVAAAIVAMWPVGFVTLSPGPTHDLLAAPEGVPVVRVQGLETFESSGHVLVTTAAMTGADAPVSLPEVLYAHWAPDRDVYPREHVYPARTSADDIRARDAQLMASSQADAAAAALRAAGIEVDQIPMVQTVSSTGPAADKLFPGDFVLAIDDTPTPTVADARAAIEARAAGQEVQFTVLRDREPVVVKIDTAPSKTNGLLPVWGGNLVMGYSYAPRIELALDPSLGGTNAGLMMALAVFDKITPGDLAGGRTVAGTGAIDGSGVVTRVSGVREKLAGAERDGADVFFVPAANCGDLADIASPVRVVSVASLEDTINSLEMLADPATEGLVKGCT